MLPASLHVWGAIAHGARDLCARRHPAKGVARMAGGRGAADTDDDTNDWWSGARRTAGKVRRSERGEPSRRIRAC